MFPVDMEPGDVAFIEAAVNFLREHGPAIRAAVGGEAVANGESFLCEALKFPEGDGVRMEAEYILKRMKALTAMMLSSAPNPVSSPPATVSVAALREFIERERSKEYRAESALAVGNLLDELAALIGEEA